MLLDLFGLWNRLLASNPYGGETRKKKKLTVLIDGKRMRLSHRELADVLNRKTAEAEQAAKEAIPVTAEQSPKAPSVEVKIVTQDVPNQVAEAIRQDVDRTNATIARLWLEAVIRQLQEDDDEECMILCL